MNTSVTLTAEEFNRIHNALCFASGLGLDATVDTIREALASAYAQEEQDFDTKMAYFRQFQRQHHLATMWSMYEFPEGCFELPHLLPSAAVVMYQKGSVPVLGPTWGDVYRAADSAIRNSGDDHHIFIEAFEAKGNQLHLVTGS